MPIVLALVSAVLYGVSDYAGGRASRTTRPLAVTMTAETVGLVGLLAVVPLLGDPIPPIADLRWGALAGVAGLVGVTSLYYALANGAMTVVAPLTGVLAAGLPVAVGLLLGERPGVLVLAGMVLGLGAVALVAGVIGIAHVRSPRIVVAAALTAGAGFGLLFVFLERTSPESGLWPLVAARFVSVPVLVVAVLARGHLATVRPATAALATAVGVMLLLANIAYLVAVRDGLLSVVAVVVSLYPAATVLLATVLDGERTTRSQTIGLALTLVALALVSLGS